MYTPWKSEFQVYCPPSRRNMTHPKKRIIIAITVGEEKNKIKIKIKIHYIAVFMIYDIEEEEEDEGGRGVRGKIMINQ